MSKSPSLRGVCCLGTRNTGSSSLAEVHPIGMRVPGAGWSGLPLASKRRPRFPPQNTQVFSAPSGGAGGDGVGTAERLSQRQESESTPEPGITRGDFGTHGASPLQIAGCRARSREEASRPPAARPPSCRPYLAGGRPLKECVQRGRARHRGDLEQQPQQERQEWRPGHHGVGTGAATGAVRGRERPLTRSWPCP